MRRQLALVALATTSLVVLALLVPLARAVSTIPRDRATSQAQLTAQSLVQSIAAVHDPARLSQLIRQTSDLLNRTVSVVMPDGTMLGEPFARSVAFERARSGVALTARTDSGVEVLTPTVLGDGMAVVRVTVTDSVLQRGVHTAWAILAGLGAILVALAVAVSDRLARSIVAPITSLASTTRALEQGDLSARVVPEGPVEVQEVGHTLNLLAVRIGELIAIEREAIADLSHRLRTPITALRLDAEGLRDPDEARRVVADVDELTKAVDHLIRTARAPTWQAAASCDLVEVVHERTEFWRVLAEDQGRNLTVQSVTGTAWVAISAESLRAAVDVLIENVFAHTDEGTPFRVSVVRMRDRVGLQIDDAGPGMDRAVEHRGASGSGSTGLGLSIARSTAERALGTLTLIAPGEGGLRATFEVPLVSRRPAGVGRRVPQGVPKSS